MTTKLICHTTKNDVEMSCNLYNQLGITEYVFAMQYNGFGTVVTVFKVPDAKVPSVWRKLGKSPETCPVQYMKDN